MGKKSRRKKKGSRTSAEGGIPPGDSGPPPGDKGGGKVRNRDSALVEWTKSLVLALVLFVFIRSFLLNTFVIISGSMEETLLVGDLLMVNRASVGSRIPGTPWRIPGYSSLRRGDVLVFDPHHEVDLMLVKRLMGLPGDTVQMRNKVLMVNGEPLDEPYVQHVDIRDAADTRMAWQEGFLLNRTGQGLYRPTRDNWGPLVVPSDHYFMMGDNRDTSLDSRYWGFLEGWRIEGRAVFVYFSYDKDSPENLSWLREIRWGRIGDRIR